jgi:hypothetical protein
MKKAGKWKPKVGDKVRMTGEIIDIDRVMREAKVSIECDDCARWIELKALRPAVEVFAWKPEKVAKKKAGKK